MPKGGPSRAQDLTVAISNDSSVSGEVLCPKVAPQEHRTSPETEESFEIATEPVLYEHQVSLLCCKRLYPSVCSIARLRLKHIKGSDQQETDFDQPGDNNSGRRFRICDDESRALFADSNHCLQQRHTHTRLHLRDGSRAPGG